MDQESFTEVISVNIKRPKINRVVEVRLTLVENISNTEVPVRPTIGRFPKHLFQSLNYVLASTMLNPQSVPSSGTKRHADS